MLLALTDTQRRFKIPVELLDQLAFGTGMDIQDGENVPQRENSRSSIKPSPICASYCYRVASVVGLVCIRIFGYRDPAAEPLAENLGLAFQLTNIIRDIQEDAAMGRIYLPAEDLGPLRDFARGASPARDSGTVALAAGGRRPTGHANTTPRLDELIRSIDEDSQPALWVLVTIYRRLLEKISRPEI